MVLWQQRDSTHRTTTVPGMLYYKYEPIINHDKFRVISLLPGAWEDEILCTLLVISLADKLSYETISYAWGDTKDTRPIHLQGSIIRVPANLESALRHLRSTRTTLTLWADSVCIDQQNVEEKARQVAMMGRIYRQCTRVYIWLGAPNPAPPSKWRLRLFASPSEAARVDPFLILRHFSEDKHIHDLACFRLSNTHNSEWIFTESAAFKVQWHSFMEAAQSTWWSRFWCVQEILLPSDAQAVFGQWRIPWRTMQIAALNHRRHMTTCCATIALQVPHGYSLFYDPLVLDPYQISRDGTDLSEPTTSSANHRDLDWIVRTNRHKDCKDPRDKIFGILGLVDQTRYPEIVPDYSLSIAQVYTKTMIVIIAKAEGDLQCLSGSGFGLHVGFAQLPSWVRDFATRPDDISMTYERMRMQTYGLYRAMGDCSVNDAKVEEESRLHLEGFRIDSIRDLGRPITGRDWRHITSRLREWHRIAGIKPTRSISELKSDPRQTAFWRTIIADVFSDSERRWRRSSEAEIDAYLEWVANAISAWKYLRQPSLDEHFVEPLLAAVIGRSFFRTNDGKFGLCYPNSQINDGVWVFPGARVPFILRADQSSYRFVGESYLHGAMNGKGTTSTDIHEENVVLV